MRDLDAVAGRSAGSKVTSKAPFMPARGTRTTAAARIRGHEQQHGQAEGEAPMRPWECRARRAAHWRRTGRRCLADQLEAHQLVESDATALRRAARPQCRRCTLVRQPHTRCAAAAAARRPCVISCTWRRHRGAAARRTSQAVLAAEVALGEDEQHALRFLQILRGHRCPPDHPHLERWKVGHEQLQLPLDAAAWSCAELQMCERKSSTHALPRSGLRARRLW